MNLSDFERTARGKTVFDDGQIIVGEIADHATKLEYIEYKYKINPRTYEWLLGDLSVTHMSSDDDYKLIQLHCKIEQTHTVRRNKDGSFDMSGDGYVYFNDIEELVFDRATEEDKKHLRKIIKEEMIVCDPPVAGWWVVYLT